jgi:hypothetical protein
VLSSQPDSDHERGRSAEAIELRAEVAQLVEHRPEEAGVVSSILTLGTSPAVVAESVLRAEVAQLVEHHLAKVRVAGSSPVFRSIFLPCRG